MYRDIVAIGTGACNAEASRAERAQSTLGLVTCAAPMLLEQPVMTMVLRMFASRASRRSAASSIPARRRTAFEIVGADRTAERGPALLTPIGLKTILAQQGLGARIL